jgi:hypothetical protein
MIIMIYRYTGLPAMGSWMYSKDVCKWYRCRTSLGHQQWIVGYMARMYANGTDAEFPFTKDNDI